MTPPTSSTPPRDARSYSLVIRGERHTFGPFDQWGALTFAQAVTILSDLTGYNADHLSRLKFDRLGYATVRPAGGFGSTPAFRLRSSDGGKPAAAERAAARGEAVEVSR